MSARLAAAILLAVLFAHHGYPYLDGLGGLSARAWHYIAIHALAALLAVLLLAVASTWLANLGRQLALAALAIAAIESSAAAICRVGLGAGGVPAGQNACDALTGLPLTSALFAGEFLLTLWLVFNNNKALNR